MHKPLRATDHSHSTLIANLGLVAEASGPARTHFAMLVLMVSVLFVLAGANQVKAEDIFSNMNTGGVINLPMDPPVFQLNRSAQISEVATYHWNDGKGVPQGKTISISLHTDGITYGPFPATGLSGQGGAPNVNWIAHPNITLPAGKYEVLDSDPSTWSQNSDSLNRGFVVVRGTFLPLQASPAMPAAASPAAGSQLTPASSSTDKLSSGGSSDKPWVAISVAIIGVVGTIGGAFIGRKTGKQSGVEEGKQSGFEEGRQSGVAEGRQHSIQKFMDVQKKQLDRAEDAIKRQDYEELRAIATGIVDNTMQWRKIQENFRALLNGRVDDLRGTLLHGTPQQLTGPILALKEGFEGKSLAVETELKKSAI